MRFNSIFLKFSFLLPLLFKSLNLSAQEAPPVFDWQNSLGGSSYDAASKVIRTMDDGYLLVGTSYSSNGDVSGNHGSGDAWVVKVDGSGVKQWQKALGGTGVDGAVSAVEFPDGKIFIACNSTSTDGNLTFNHGVTDVWIVALDAAGSILWQKTFGGIEDDFAKAVIKTSDGQLLIAGTSHSADGDLTGNFGGDDFWLLKIDTLGLITWQKNYGGSSSDICNGVVEMNDGGYVAIGSSGSLDDDVTGNHGQNDFWVVKTDASGNLSWQKSYGGDSNESALSVIKNTVGNIVIAGYTNSSDGDVTDKRGGSDYWLLMLDTAGALIKQATYGGSNSDVAYSVVQADDGGYLISGGSFSTDFDIFNHHGGEDFCLIKVDGVGNLKWSRTFGGGSTDRNFSAEQTPDGGYILTGYTLSNDQQVGGNHGSADVWIAKLSCKTPVSSFVFADDTTCLNSIIDLTNTSVNSAVYSWLADGIPFGDTANARFQFTSAGSYSMSLLASTCYESDQSSHVFTVYDYPVIPTVTLGGFTFQSTPAASYQWFSKGQAIPGAIDQSYAASAEGYYYVMVGNAGRCFTFSDSIYFDITAVNGIENNALEIYPNPANDRFEVRGLGFEVNALEIFNSVGEKVYSAQQEGLKIETVIDCKQFPSGIYFLHIESKTGDTFRKIVVSH